MEHAAPPPQRNSLQPEPAKAIVFRSIREHKMKGSLKLSARLDSQAAEHLAAELAQQRGHSLALDAGQVTFLGALALQLLLAAHRQWVGDGKSFRIVNPTTAFLEGVSLLGIDAPEIGLDDPAEVAQ